MKKHMWNRIVIVIIVISLVILSLSIISSSSIPDHESVGNNRDLTPVVSTEEKIPALSDHPVGIYLSAGGDHDIPQ